MFTGIIETLGTIKSLVPSAGGLQITVEGPFGPSDIGIGDSIAVNGVCLTAVSLHRGAFSVDASPETLSKTTLGRAKVRDQVNLERALCLGDRLGGHLVTGHVDGVGKVRARRQAGNAVLFTFEVAEDLSRYLIRKGSVAVDGISLTVNACDSLSFEVSIIAHTLRVTTLGNREAGDEVNIETDMIGKYVERFTRPFAEDSRSGGRGNPGVDESFLKKTGFL